MSEFCKDHHCWHDSGQVLMSYPPQSVQICCNCGVRKTIRHEVIQSFEGHGKYHPQNYIILDNKNA